MPQDGQGTMVSTQLPISGLTCGSCAKRLEDALRATEGVVQAAVSYESGTALVGFTPATVSVEMLRLAVGKAGFAVGDQGQFQTIATRGGRRWVQAFIDHVDAGKCTGCGQCVKACGQGVYALAWFGEAKKAVVVNGDNCLGDCHCHKACRFDALVCMPVRLAPV
ncbi:MAG: cation transporter [Chloroflexota bacterium]